MSKSLSFSRGIVNAAAAISIASLALVAPAHSQDSADAPAGAEPPAGSVGGMGDINLYPKRIVIDARQRIATVGLYNRTANSGDYKIDIVNMMMTPEGRLLSFDNFEDEAAKARVKTASEIVRWSPKNIRLLGNEAQTVRIMARPPADLPDGEYRSHFMAVAVPDSEDLGFSIDDAIGNNGSQPNIGVSIVPRFGISIPVIVRVGETTLDVGLTNMQLGNTPDGQRAMAFTLTRSGTRSAFGDITITAGGRTIASARGVGVYPEVDSRQVVIVFNEEAQPADFARGSRLEVTYTDDDYEPGAILARQEFVVP